MRDSEIKTLFAKADEQVHIDEIRKQKTYYAMIEEMEKQRTPMMSTKNILLHQFWYMDKSLRKESKVVQTKKQY